MERNFQTKYEFKDAICRGCDLVFEWKGAEYGIFPAPNNQRLVCALGTDSQNVYYDSIEDVMHHKIEGERLIDICTRFTVVERNI